MARKEQARRRAGRHRDMAIKTGVETFIQEIKIKTPNFVMDYFNTEFGLKSLVHQVSSQKHILYTTNFSS